MTDLVFFVESNTTGTGKLYFETAQRLGLRPYILTNTPERYRFLTNSPRSFIMTDTSRLPSIEATIHEVMKRNRVVAVTSSSDYYVDTAARVAKSFGLPGPDPDMIALCRNKDKQISLLQEAGISVPEFALIDSDKNIEDSIRKLGLPLVVKPSSGSGSFGVKLCQSVDAVRKHYRVLRDGMNERGMKLCPKFIAEKWIEGDEFSIETFDTTVVGITKKHLSLPPTFVETGHDFPDATLSGSGIQLLEDIALSAIHALGLEWGPNHVEARLNSTGAYIIEVNPRLAGGNIPRLVKLATGIDLVESALLKLLGHNTVPTASIDRYASIRFLMTNHSGNISDIVIPAEVLRDGSIHEIEKYVKPGDRVEIHGDFRDRLGHVIAVGANPREVCMRVERALKSVKVLVDNSV